MRDLFGDDTKRDLRVRERIEARQEGAPVDPSMLGRKCRCAALLLRLSVFQAGEWSQLEALQGPARRP
jgi:hypothetical protein